jgi:hypothetical protein
MERNRDEERSVEDGETRGEKDDSDNEGIDSERGRLLDRTTDVEESGEGIMNGE